MSERTNNGCAPENNMCNDTSTCIQTRKVYGSCKDKECLENLRVYLTLAGQELVNSSINIKCRKAELSGFTQTLSLFRLTEATTR